MATYVEIAKADELEDGRMKKVELSGRQILLAQVGGTYYAADSTCPHMGGDLSKGSLEGTIVTCPRHHSQFDLRDGRVVRWTDWTGLKLMVGKLLKSPRPLTVHGVKRQDDSILVELKEDR